MPPFPRLQIATTGSCTGRLNVTVWVPGEPVRAIRSFTSAGDVVTLDRGKVSVDFVEDVPAGMLVLALDEPPGRAPLRFYR